MKIKAFILGLFVLAFAASAHAQHTPNSNNKEQVERKIPRKYKGDKKMVSRKQGQSQARAAKKAELAKDKKMTKAEHNAIVQERIAKKKARKGVRANRQRVVKSTTHSKNNQQQKARQAPRKLEHTKARTQ